MAEETSVFSLWGSNRTLRNLQLLPPVECVVGEEAKLEEMRVSHRFCRCPPCCPSGGPQTTLNKLQVYTCINTVLQLIFISLHFHFRYSAFSASKFSVADFFIIYFLCLQALLGPYASEARLTSHLRAVRGKVFWAGTAAISAPSIFQISVLANTTAPRSKQIPHPVACCC